MKIYLATLFLCLFQLGIGQTYLSVSEIPDPKSNGDGFISDPENYITADYEIEINKVITEIRDKKGFEIAVVVVTSIGEKAPLPFATEIINEWGVGKGDRGIVILVAVEDRNMAFATGYATEEFIPDLVTKRISEEEITPYFKLDNYGQGILNGVETVRNIVLNENVPDYVEQLKQDQKNLILWEYVGLAAALLLIFLAIIISPQQSTIWTSLGLIGASLIVAFAAYYFMFRERHTKDVVWDIFSVLVFISSAVNTFRILKQEPKKIWAFAVYMSLVVPIPMIGFYLYGMQIVVEVYLLGAAFVFGIFLISYVFALLTKDSYKKYHRLKLYKLDVFGYIFPLPMYVVDMLVENLLEKWRNQVRFSSKTGLEMRKLSEAKDNEYLEKGQVTEEQIKSVDYDVWITDEPDDILVLRYNTWFTKYNSCSACGYKTWYLVYDRTITSATYSSSGTGERKKACAHCKHQDISRYTIPQLQESSSSSSGGSSYSSSSSSGGSWGGGSSGGGGSSSSW